MEFDIPDVYKLLPKKQVKQRHILQPQETYRALFIGPSGSSKTTQLVNFLLPSGKDGSFFPYQKLYIFSPTIKQEKFEILKSTIEKLEEEINKKTKKEFKIWHASENPKDALSIESKLDPDFENLVVFDDYLTNPSILEAAKNLYIRGRHANISVVFLSQEFYGLPAEMRKNSNIFAIFPGLTPRNISSLAQDIPLYGLPTKKFKEIVMKTTTPTKDEPYPYLYIDLTNKDKRYLIRKTAIHPTFINEFTFDTETGDMDSDEDSDSDVDEKIIEIKKPTKSEEKKEDSKQMTENVSKFIADLKLKAKK